MGERVALRCWIRLGGLRMDPLVSRFGSYTPVWIIHDLPVKVRGSLVSPVFVYYV